MTLFCKIHYIKWKKLSWENVLKSYIYFWVQSAIDVELFGTTRKRYFYFVNYLSSSTRCIKYIWIAFKALEQIKVIENCDNVIVQVQRKIGIRWGYGPPFCILNCGVPLNSVAGNFFPFSGFIEQSYSCNYEQRRCLWEHSRFIIYIFYDYTKKKFFINGFL